MEQLKNSLKSAISSVDNNPNQQLKDEIIQINEPQHESSTIPSHLSNAEQMSRIRMETKNKLLKSGRFRWNDEFKIQMDVQVLETDFQWMKVLLHYGNYQMVIYVIYTEIDGRVFQHTSSKSGAFGVVRFVEFQRQNFAVKGVKISYNNGDIDTENLYKEYFLGCMASIIQVGPKISLLFGYDILLCKSMAFFSMQQCKPIQLQSLPLIQSELRNNLKVMHAIKLVHSDIKPENAAFSTILKKHIFIDFGLSKLIKQPPGEKTKSKFSGTLCYCSQQMKKCYLLKVPKFVDLYENDVCCLEKTIKAAENLLKVKKFMKNFTPKSDEKEDQFGVFYEVIRVLRFKYCILIRNVQRIKKILKTLQSQRVIYEIFGQEIPKFLSEDECISSKLNQIKEKILKSSSQISKADKIDAILCEFFDREKRITSAEKIVPISQIVQSEPQFFSQYLVKPELLLKLFHFFEPFSQNSANIQNRIELKKIIVNKIYQIKNPNFISPVFQTEKMRFALNYFYQNLKSLKNLKVMLSLRLLFLSILEFHQATVLQYQISKMIEDPFLRMLKLGEIILFRFSYEQGQKKIHPKQQQTLKKILQYYAVYAPKLTKLYEIITQCQSLPNSEQLNETKIAIIRKINEVSKECYTFYQKQSIYLIKYICISICRLHFSVFQEQAPKGLALDIYSRRWNSFKVKLNSCQLEDYKLFQSQFYELANQGKKYFQQDLLNKMIENQILILENRNQPFSTLISSIVEYCYFYPPEKKHVHFFLQKIRYLFSNNKQPISKFMVFSRITYINQYLQYLLKSTRHADQNKPIQKQVKLSIFDDIENIFQSFIEEEKVKQIIKNQKQLQLFVMTIRIKLRFEKGQTLENIQRQIQQLVGFLQPFSNQPYNYITNFFTIYVYLRRSLRPSLQPSTSTFTCTSTATATYTKNLFLHIFNQFLASKKFHILQIKPNIPVDYMRICTERGNYYQILKVMLDLVEYFQNEGNRRGFIFQLPVRFFVHIVDVYFKILGEGQAGVRSLVDYYLGDREKGRREIQSEFYGYFVFLLFLGIRNQISEALQLKQVIKTTIILDKMPTCCRRRAKFQIVRLYKHLVPFKSNRKSFICRRLQIRNTQDVSKFGAFMKELRGKVDRLPSIRRQMQSVIQKFNAKIFNYQRL